MYCKESNFILCWRDKWIDLFRHWYFDSLDFDDPHPSQLLLIHNTRINLHVPKVYNRWVFDKVYTIDILINFVRIFFYYVEWRPPPPVIFTGKTITHCSVQDKILIIQKNRVANTVCPLEGWGSNDCSVYFWKIETFLLIWALIT